jgi:predicted ATPase
MKGFKLLGIKTKDRIDTIKHPDLTDYLKVLKENTYYGFYNNFIFSEGVENITIKYKPNTLENLHNIKTDNGKEIDVNISAIVGKNGSGKSTLLELFYLAIYNLGCSYELLEYYEEDINYTGPSYNDECEKIIPHIKKYSKLKNISLDLYFTKGSKIYQLRFLNNAIYLAGKSVESNITFSYEINNADIISKDYTKELSKIFYSIAINYSIYGLNSKYLGDWIKPLFHKNDGYKTPIVINPMRTEGNFDINDEMEFATYRLLNNLLIERYLNNKKKITKRISVTDKQYVSKVRFRFNKEKVKKYPIEDSGIKVKGKTKPILVLRDIYTVFFSNQEVDILQAEIPYRNQISNYLTQKVDKIINTYDQYKEGYDYDVNNITTTESNTKFFKKLKEDKSHITFKLRQSVNFFKNCIEKGNKIKKREIANSLELDTFFEFSLDELLKWMDVSDVSDIINNIPPSIFSIEILLSNGEKKNKNNKVAFFTDLSSGEQQLIHTIQSVLYHINNIQSIHHSGQGNRLCYEYVNIIFDEIELYFHPEYQRKFINDLLNSFKRLDLGEKGKGVKGINIIFSTHSPFILSDIPSSNILMLNKENGTKKIKTFGANIHELLGDSFFLENGYVGEFAKIKIEELIKFYNNPKSSSHSEESSLGLIKLIDDELISDRLIEMHNECFKIDKDISEITDENYENWLNEELSRIKKGS